MGSDFGGAHPGRLGWTAGRAVPGAVLAPVAPGRLGQAAGSTELLEYLAALGRWRDARKSELDHLDAAALATTEPDRYSADIVLSMALWHSVARRHDELEAVWDSGRVDRAAKERLSRLIWGRMEASAAGMALTLVEACRLSDALAVQLRSRLSVDPSAGDDAARLRAARTSAERVRDLVEELPLLPGPREEIVGVATTAEASLRGIDRALAEVAEWIGRGADPGDRLIGLEQRLARLERDVIVSAAQLRQATKDAVVARTARAELSARGEAIEREAARVAKLVRPVPRLGVPDVDALGEPPTDPAGLRAYVKRLDAVRRALDLAELAYRAPLAEVEELRGRLGAYEAKARARGLLERAEVRDALRAAREATQPAGGRVDLGAARAAVAAVAAVTVTVPAAPPPVPPKAPRPWRPPPPASTDPGAPLPASTDPATPPASTDLAPPPLPDLARSDGAPTPLAPGGPA